MGESSMLSKISRAVGLSSPRKESEPAVVETRSEKERDRLKKTLEKRAAALLGGIVVGTDHPQVKLPDFTKNMIAEINATIKGMAQSETKTVADIHERLIEDPQEFEGIVNSQVANFLEKVRIEEGSLAANLINRIPARDRVGKRESMVNRQEATDKQLALDEAKKVFGNMMREYVEAGILSKQDLAAAWKDISGHLESDALISQQELLKIIYAWQADLDRSAPIQ